MNKLKPGDFVDTSKLTDSEREKVKIAFELATGEKFMPGYRTKPVLGWVPGNGPDSGLASGLYPYWLRPDTAERSVDYVLGMPEWNGTGLPPVGCECMARTNGGCLDETVVVAVSGNEVWLKDLGVFDIDSVDFSPIRTEAEKQREADKDKLFELLMRCEDEGDSKSVIASTILSAGFTRGGGDE